MKKLLFILVAFTVLATACSKSKEVTVTPTVKEQTYRFRVVGRDNSVYPAYHTATDNPYQKGDSVWVYAQTGKIQHGATWGNMYDSNGFVRVSIDSLLN